MDEKLAYNKEHFNVDKLYQSLELIMFGKGLYSKEGIQALNQLKDVMAEWKYIDINEVDKNE